jgi:chromosome segregation ATPase
MTLLPYILAAFASLVAAILGALQFARRFSGQIKSSEAVTLWEAQEAFRQDLMKRNDRLRDRLDQCEKTILSLQERLEQMEEANHVLHLENGELKAKLADYDKLLAQKDKEIEGLEAKVKRLQARVRELETHDGHGQK